MTIVALLNWTEDVKSFRVGDCVLIMVAFFPSIVLGSGVVVAFAFQPLPWKVVDSLDSV
jgi:hypothetical protein